MSTLTADLRSDTVTKPTPGMLDAMFSAPVGDDVFGEDPSINELERMAANLLGMDAAVFCPSGTMTNQIGISINTRPFSEIICYKGAHIYKYEGGGLAGNSQLSVRLLDGSRGRLSAADVLANVNNAADPHQPITSLVALENTVVREAGAFYTMAQMAEVTSAARSMGLRTHLDGARLFNAFAATGDNPAETGKHFDSVSICLSKGLGAPVGSLVLCSADQAVMARRRRKSLGGGMRQAGFLAAAGIYALRHNIGRLTEDHGRARVIADLIKNQPWVAELMPVDTNIIIFRLVPSVTPADFLRALGEQQVRAVQFGPDQVRMVTHLDIHDDHLQVVKDAVARLRF